VGRAAKSDNFATMLYDEGVTLSKTAKWSEARWKAEAETRGMKPPSSKTIAETKAQLGQMGTSKGKQ